METVPFLAKVAPAMVDPEARALWLSDPRAALLAAGIDVPEWATITCVEGQSLGVAVTLGPLIDEGEFTEELLDEIAGGTVCSSCNCAVVCG